MEYMYDECEMIDYLLNNSSDFTDSEWEDYENGSSKFYNEDSVVLFSLEDIYK